MTPAWESTTITTTSARAIDFSLWADTLASIEALSPVPGGSQPPVSTTVNSRPCQWAGISLRSRVMPGCSATMASRRPKMRFISVDLPTLGRPTMATVGTVPAAGPATALATERPSERGPVGGHHLHWAG